MIDPAALEDMRARNSCVDVARDHGARLRAKGVGKFVGSCPMCGGGVKAMRFEASADKWVCAVCSDGGDVIRLVERARGVDFIGAVEILGGARALTQEDKDRLAKLRAERAAAEARRATAYREKARADAYEIWRASVSLRNEGLRYVDARGLSIGGASALRFAPTLGYFEGGEVIHRGPAILAAIQRRDGHFHGLHRTWIDPDHPGEKIKLFDAEGEPLAAKKSLGSTKGGVIKLYQHGQTPRRLFIGEGIETVLSVYTALLRERRLRDGDTFWSSVDLHNLGGDAKENLPHPQGLKGRNGHVLKLPGPEPTGESWACPETVTTLVLLGDGDSERALTQWALERARRRHARPGRDVFIRMAPDGMDFNDLARGKALASSSDVRDARTKKEMAA